jgi:hypothetical protein
MQFELLEPITWPVLTVVGAVVMATAGGLIRYHLEQRVTGHRREPEPTHSHRATVPRKLSLKTPLPSWRRR